MAKQETCRHNSNSRWNTTIFAPWFKDFKGLVRITNSNFQNSIHFQPGGINLLYILKQCFLIRQISLFEISIGGKDAMQKL